MEQNDEQGQILLGWSCLDSVSTMRSGRVRGTDGAIGAEKDFAHFDRSLKIYHNANFHSSMLPSCVVFGKVAWGEETVTR